MEVWEHFECWDLMKKFHGMGCFDLIRWIFGKVKKEVFELFCVILWGLWNERNEFVHAGKVNSAVVIGLPEEAGPPTTTLPQGRSFYDESVGGGLASSSMRRRVASPPISGEALFHKSVARQLTFFVASKRTCSSPTMSSNEELISFGIRGSPPFVGGA
ncbi:hypothetical protein LWI29_022791 [Acer saccharum]|uniref:Uncharacterized protein n=1 Tax=Acer saccharum TaxID=4024 RepID=A0AA39SH11_ACESA|nr:hypothetical protein LWI29_022791 [Acer saccharum]